MPARTVSNAAHEIVGGNVFQHVGLRASLERTRDLVVGVVGRQHDDACVRVAPANLPNHLDAFHHRHSQVEQRHVGTMALVGLDRLDAVARLGDDTQVGLLVDDVGDAGSKQRVIVHQQHAGATGAATDRGVSSRHGPASAATDGSHASTTSVPLRGAVTIVSDAPIRSARSCMLVMPNPADDGSRAMPRPSSATDSRSPTDCDRRRANRDAARARVTDGIGQRLLRDRDDLAFDAVAEAGKFVHDEIDRHVARPLTQIGEALERRRDVLAVPDIGTKRADRSSCFGQVRARQVDRRLDLRRDGWRRADALALRTLKLHQNRGKPLREVVVNVAREAVALFEDALAALLAPMEIDQAAVVQRQRCLTGDGLDQHDAPPPALGLRGPRAADGHPAQSAVAEEQRRGDRLVPVHSGG